MSNEKFNQSINQVLNKNLEKIDQKTKMKLATIRRHALLSAQQETANDVNRNMNSYVVVLSSHPLWKNKKVASITLGLALAASVILVMVMPGILQKNTAKDFSSDFVFYSEVDPDWLMDMEIAEVLGDD
ncbi:MAG: DUF3619 family protein [Cellvibrio sp.]|nr:DUF3619 family protein [Cellvibrio sp.]